MLYSWISAGNSKNVCFIYFTIKTIIVKNLLGSEQWRANNSLKHCESSVVFENEESSHSNIKLNYFY